MDSVRLWTYIEEATPVLTVGRLIDLLADLDPATQVHLSAECGQIEGPVEAVSLDPETRVLFLVKS